MRKYSEILCLVAGITSLVFAVATGITMLAKGMEIKLWVILVCCIFILMIACAKCTAIEKAREEETPTKKDTTTILCEAYKAIFMKSTDDKKT